MRIALDAMGGDNAPGPTVQGAIEAAEDGLHIILVGDEAVLRDEIATQGGLPPNVHLHHASEVVEMDDGPRDAFRRKKDSSLRVAFELVRSGQADAVVTMGNSGAALAMGMFVCQRLEGVRRPAISALFSGREGPAVLLDVGANTECRPDHLADFGLMGSALMQAAFGIDQPRLGLLSNGEEDGKGTELTRETATLLADLPGIEYTGPIEPGELLTNRADVIVTDGWTGNILIKTAEAIISHFRKLVREASDRNVMSQAGALLLKPSLREALAEVDYSEYGGGILLGIDACAVIGHGAAESTEIAKAIRFARQISEHGLLQRIQASLTERSLGTGS